MSREQYEPVAREAARRHGVPEEILVRLITQESNWRADARNPSGAAGIAQFMPTTAAGLGIDPMDPVQALDGAARFLKQCIAYLGGDVEAGVAAYNGGPGAMRRWHAAFGAAWREALRTEAHQWPAIATYGTPAKAAEVALYLDRVYGPADAPPPTEEEPPVNSIESEIEWVGARHFGRGRDGHTPKAIVLHIADSSKDGLAGRRAVDSWFQAEASLASTHYCVGGGISQYVALADMAWANGKVESGWNRNLPWLADAVARGINPNDLTVSIESAGKPFTGTPAYVDTADRSRLVRLVSWLCSKYGIVPSAQTIVGHRDISPQSRPNCPGPRLNFGPFILEVQAAGAGGGVVQPPDVDPAGGKTMLPGSTMPQYIREQGLGTAFTDETPCLGGSMLFSKDGAQVYTVLYREYTKQLKHLAW